MTVISLFSGAGGFDLGFVEAGHKIRWANDNDEDAVGTYRLNIGPHILPGDISDIPSEKIPSGDVVIGGFPCQGFSHANRLRSRKDKRNKLYLEFVRVVRDKKPKYFLAENVRGILSLDNGRVIKRIANDFQKVGYAVETRLFNVADYGVPQSRFRVIIAGTRNDLPGHLRYRFPDPTHSKRADDTIGNFFDANIALTRWVSVGEALSGIPDPEEASKKFPNHIYSKYKVTDRNFTGHRRTDPEKPSPTILARGNGRGGVCAIMHPRNHRRMTIRESALVQTFPLGFEFVGLMNSCYRQVGNAVPVLFAKKLGEQFKELEILGAREA
jgi:DNA (cytosine-5)-methyltransferase 1